MSVPALSVLLPNYNHSEFLPKCLDEILAQSFTDFEVIVIDDASTDDSVRVIEEYARRDRRVRFYRNPENKGVVYTLNRCMDLARADLVMGAAADDYVTPKFFDAAVRLLRAHPRAAIATGMVECVSDDGHVVYRGPGQWSQEATYLPPELLATRMTDCGVPGPSIWRKELFRTVGGYKPELKWHCDWFALQVLAFRYGVCFIPQTVTIVRATPEAYSSAGQRKSDTQRPVLQRLLTELAAPECSDVLPLIGQSGTFRQFGAELVRAVATMTPAPAAVIQPVKEVVFGHAINLIYGGEVEDRVAVIRFLPRYGAEAFAFYFPIRALKHDPSPDVRAAAADACRQIARSVPRFTVVKERVRRWVSVKLRWLEKVRNPRHHEQMAQLEKTLNHVISLVGQVGWTLHCMNKTLDRVFPPEILPAATDAKAVVKKRPDEKRSSNAA